MLILSLYSGLDLFGRAFEELGHCVVRGPEIITYGDIRDFSCPPDVFDMVMGGPPCVDYSLLNRNPSDYSDICAAEFMRIVEQSRCRRYLIENVPQVPDMKASGYHWQRFNLDLQWFTEYSRLRAFQYGTLDGRMIEPMSGKRRAKTKGGAVTGGDSRSYAEICHIQGLPDDFDIPFFNLEAKRQVVANAVPLALGRYIAGLVTESLGDSPDSAGSERPAAVQASEGSLCACHCGRRVFGAKKTATDACRKRVSRTAQKKARDKAGKL